MSTGPQVGTLGGYPVHRIVEPIIHDLSRESWRKLLAGMAMAGALASMPEGYELPFAANHGDGTESPETIVAKSCCKLAEAILAELEKPR